MTRLNLPPVEDGPIDERYCPPAPINYYYAVRDWQLEHIYLCPPRWRGETSPWPCQMPDAFSPIGDVIEYGESRAYHEA